MEGSTFDVWLGVKLKSLGTDENVFGDYIKSILEGDESQEEKIEALEGILAEISPVSITCSHMRHYSLSHLIATLYMYIYDFSDRWSDSK